MQHKGVLTTVREYALILSTIITTFGVCGIFIKAGEYKIKFENVINQVDNIEKCIEDNVKENRVEHSIINTELDKLRVAVAIYKNNNYYRD